VRACLKNRSRRGEEADQGAILARNPPPYVGGYATRSDTARERLLSVAGEPLFLADWERVLMLHYEVEPDALQRVVPFELDLRDGRAFVSAVAFTMRGMRPRVGGRFAAWLFKPIATHEFLNVRTYVRHRGESGIYFLAGTGRQAVMLAQAFVDLATCVLAAGIAVRDSQARNRDGST